MRSRISMHALALAVIATALTLPGAPAQAGCGCDHPPPSWSVVMPPFGSPGREITIHADGFSFEPGVVYEVEVGGPMAYVVAEFSDRIMTVVPDLVPPGPVAIKVQGPGVDATYSDALFTALPPARHVEGEIEGAVDVGDVLEPTQFTFALHELPLHFEADDVVIYNADGVDLTAYNSRETAADVEDLRRALGVDPAQLPPGASGAVERNRRMRDISPMTGGR